MVVIEQLKTGFGDNSSTESNICQSLTIPFLDVFGKIVCGFRVRWLAGLTRWLAGGVVDWLAVSRADVWEMFGVADPLYENRVFGQQFYRIEHLSFVDDSVLGVFGKMLQRCLVCAWLARWFVGSWADVV